MINKLKSSKYLQSIIQLTKGSIIAQIITILVSPLSTRIYSPAELGIYTLILTFSTIFGPVIAGKYEMAIVSADSDETFDLIIGSLAFTTISSILITFGYYFYLRYNPQIYETVGFTAYILILILVLQGVINILSSYNNRYKQYKLISDVYVIRTFIQNLSLIFFGLLKFGITGLLLSQFTGLLFGLKKQSKYLIKSKILQSEVNVNKIKETLLKYKNQPIYSMPAHFANSASYSLLNFYISGLYGLTNFGYYSMSYRILGLPLSLISANVSKVFFQRASEEYAEFNNYHKSFLQMTLFLIVLAIPMVAFFLLFSPYLFELIFGNGWDASGKYVQILAPMYGIRFVVTALSPALIVSHKQKLELFLHSAFVVLSISIYLLTHMYNLSIEWFLVCISVTYSIVYLVFFITIYYLSKQDSKSKGVYL